MLLAEKLLPFTASRDVMDSLRIEASILAPEQDGIIKERARGVKRLFSKLYRPFIPKYTLQKNRNLEERIVIMNRDTYEVMFSEWDSSSRGNEKKLPRGIMGSYFVEGQLAAFNHPHEMWQFLTPELIASLTATMSEKEAKHVVANAAFFDNLTHEIVHQFQDSSKPISFLECAVRYYQRDLMQRLDYSYFVVEQFEAQIAYFGKLVSVYGDDAHKVFFGSQLDALKNAEILFAMSDQEMSKLFPGV